MPFENFPYADLHNLNLDWLLKQVKEDHDLLSGMDFQTMIDASVQEAIDDGRIGDLINETLLRQIRDRLLFTDEIVAGHTTDISGLKTRATTLERRTAPAKVAMLGCPAASTLDSSRGYSLCVVVHNDEFCLVYDMGNDNAATLMTYLALSGITKVDAFIISHYHNDHVQVAGVNAVCAGVDVTKWYLPHGSINWSSYIGTPTYSSVEASVKAAIVAGGDTWEEPASEGQQITLANQCLVEFFNLDPSYFVDYYSYQRDEDNDPIAHTNYNNFSMCARVSVGGRMLALTGDIELPGQENMASMIEGADILQIPHHGLDLIDSETFRRAMSGKIFLTAAYGVGREARLRTVANLMVQKAGELGASVSNVDGNSIVCAMGGTGCWILADQAGVPTPSGTFGDNIPSGADLDDYDRIGFVGFIKNASAASGISNRPTGETGAGIVMVTSSNQNSNATTGSIMQWYVSSFSYGDPHIFVRWKYEGTWEPWQDYEADLAT